jgi:hypothetical protein
MKLFFPVSKEFIMSKQFFIEVCICSAYCDPVKIYFLTDDPAKITQKALVSELKKRAYEYEEKMQAQKVAYEKDPKILLYSSEEYERRVGAYHFVAQIIIPTLAWKTIPEGRYHVNAWVDEDTDNFISMELITFSTVI